MLHKELTVKNGNGLNAKSAAALAAAVNGFASRILIEKDNKKVNAKSVMGILSLAVKNGEQVHVVVTGEDEQNAMDALSSLFDGGSSGN
jgi:phosphotransferase system HPr (HPr) family protein